MAFALLSAATGFAGSPAVTVTPWCDNSLRVRVTPSTLPAAAQAAADHLRATLQRNSLADARFRQYKPCPLGRQPSQPWP